MFSYYLSSVSVAEWPPFGKKAAHSIDHMFHLCFDYVILVLSHFDFEGLIWVLIASVPDLCIRFASIEARTLKLFILVGWDPSSFHLLLGSMGLS